LGVGALEPFEGEVRLAAVGMDLGNLKSRIGTVLALEVCERRSGDLREVEGVVDERQAVELPERICFLLNLAQGVVSLALPQQRLTNQGVPVRTARIEFQRLTKRRLRLAFPPDCEQVKAIIGIGAWSQRITL
jgi:hypothetical protein